MMILKTEKSFFDYQADTVEQQTPLERDVSTKKQQNIIDAPFAEQQTNRIIITAVEDSWVKITAGEEVLFAKILPKGESYFVPNKEGLILSLGNAGETSIVVDGKVLPILGKPGEVIRNIQLTPGGLFSLVKNDELISKNE